MRSGRPGRQTAPAITGSRGNITLRLPAQSYSKAEVALHTVNGKRVLRGKADASQTSSVLSRRNVAAGVYMLSVKGANGGDFSTRLTHSGGKMNINVAFGAEGASHERRLEKQAAAEDGDWEITVAAGGYISYEYTLRPRVGMNDIQVITLEPASSSGNMFTDSRDSKPYKKVTIGSQVWMAENLNYDVPNVTSDVCYNNSPDSCVKYGRLYDWGTAMGLEDSYYGKTWGGSDVNHQGVCPVGWHLPSNAEWTQLTDFVGGASTAGTKLKSSTGWNSYSGVPAGTDDFGFSALPGGNGNSDGYFSSAGNYGTWWSATEYDAYNA
jgi:uncharacterized protein (TIGR02145 family)